MPDDRYNGPRTNDLWPPADESSADDAWSPAPEAPTGTDSWSSDPWASSGDSSDDVWAPPADTPGDPPLGRPWMTELWATPAETPTDTSAPTDTWVSTVDTPAAESPVGAPWVSEAWPSTDPSAWVSDAWASTDPSTAGTTDTWTSADEAAGYPDPRSPEAGEERVDQRSVADRAGPVNEPFWRSESWLLEEPSAGTQSVDLTTDPASGTGVRWPDDSANEPPPPPVQWVDADDSDVRTDDRADHDAAGATQEPVTWGDLGEVSESTWSSYQQDLDAPASEPPSRPPSRAPATLEAPTNASDFAAQRGLAVPAPPTKGFPGLMYKVSAGHVRMTPTKDEQIRRDSIADIRRSVDGLRQITFTNPKGGSGKTTAALLTSMTLGQLRGGYVLAWDNNETQGTLGVRARRDENANTVRDLISDLPSFSGPVAGRVGDLAKYVRTQGDAMFDILASDEQADAGEMMTAAAFQAVREVVGRFYKIICVDTGNNVRAANWAASIDSTDQLVVTASVRWESAYSASRMLDYLEQSGRGDLVSNAMTLLTMPASMKGLNLSQVETHFAARTREVLHVPFDEQLDDGDEIPFGKLAPATRRAWLQIGAAIVRGL